MKNIDLSRYGIKNTIEVIHNPSYEKLFEEEMKLLGENLVLIAMGKATYDFLNKCLGKKYRIYQILHYSGRIGQEKYREEVLNALKDI